MGRRTINTRPFGGGQPKKGENMENKELLEQFEIVAGQLALAESFHQPRKEKQYEKKLLELEAEILKRMGD